MTGSLSPFIPLLSFVSHRDWGLGFFPECWKVQVWSRQALLIAVCDLFSDSFYAVQLCLRLLADSPFLAILFVVACLLFVVSSPGSGLQSWLEGLRSSAPALICSVCAEDGERVLDFCSFATELLSILRSP